MSRSCHPRSFPAPASRKRNDGLPARHRFERNEAELFFSRKDQLRTDIKAEKFEKDEDGNVEARYVLNGGGPTIHVETTDGDIEILKLGH